ncbi:CatB-related O-acetyltransferase [Maribacter polysiphoniae]|uniref:CatB-related O-acetyltransferase n=1 Tax=Maribacter polysiphoniae TaxID=429344 RepID=UPI0023554068|nr:CatB-related O-acetyltransferase [Maribacter polysiphoniae]
MSYLKSVFSIKKILYKDISPLSYWDSTSSFTKHTRLGALVRLLGSNIGKYTIINRGCSLVYTTIGNFSSLAGYIQLGAGRHPLNYIGTSEIFYNKNSLNNQWVKPIDFAGNLPISIGSDVWIGSQAFVMGGVNIGHGAVVGSRSVVTKDVPPYAVVAGVPGKIIKYRFSEEIIDRLLEIKWWDFDDDEIQKNIDFFREPEIDMSILEKYFPK